MLNQENQSALWTKLASFEMNEGDASFSFEKRLAKENGWSPEYTARVTTEYRRFVYLCATAGHPCSPSDAVDQAWHLHMIYTESYWDRMMPLLPRPLHHQPSKGGEAESQKFDDWYGQTLVSYHKVFWEQPPADIWPPVGQHLKKRAIPVDPHEHYIIPRRVVKGTFGGAVLAILALFGCLGFASEQIGNEKKAILAIVMVIGIALAAAIAMGLSKRQGPGNQFGGSSCGSNFGTYGASCSGGGDGGGCSGGCGGGCGGGGCGGS